MRQFAPGELLNFALMYLKQLHRFNQRNELPSVIPLQIAEERVVVNNPGLGGDSLPAQIWVLSHAGQVLTTPTSIEQAIICYRIFNIITTESLS